MIKISDITFSYDKNQKLFRDLKLELHPGKIYGLLGKNGTGKSTLLKLINGVLFPKQGNIFVNDYNSSKRKVQMLQSLFFLTEDYILPAIKMDTYVNLHSGFYPKFDKRKFYEIIEAFQLSEKKKLNQLSLGQKKKVSIAFALATNAKYLLLDEPTNGLDIPSKSQFRKVMAKGYSEHQMVIISTHQIRDLGNLLETVIVIDEGQIIFNKDVSAIEDKLLFRKSLSPEKDTRCLYTEMTSGAYIHVLPNDQSEPSEVELEVLFNALTTDKDLITKQF